MILTYMCKGENKGPVSESNISCENSRTHSNFKLQASSSSSCLTIFILPSQVLLRRTMVRKNGVKEKRPSFFKRIPPQFLKHLRKYLSSKATLSLNMTSQCSWNVKVTKTKNDVYFKDGWQEFLNNN
ncbi:hypothetical protein ACLB2K_020650 [Fragaria x ananassa]